MDIASDDSGKITIRCPKCTQRFKVGPDFMGKMVECGGCDERFRVSEDVVVRARKFYPGEHRDPALERFSRVPMKSGPMPQFQPAQVYGGGEGRPVQTFSPLRLVVGIVAVLFVVLVGLLFIVGGGPGQLLDGASMTKRLVLAAFTGVIALCLLVAANPYARKKGLAGGLVSLAVLLSLPFVFRTGLPDPRRTVGVDAGPVPVVAEPLPLDPHAAMKEEMTYSKLQEAITEYGPDGVKDGVTAIGVWLRDVREYNKDLIVKYLIRSTQAGDKSWAYSRPPSDYLVVLHGVKPDVKAVAAVCERFGEVGRVVDELNVVEVNVDNQRFVAGSLSKLGDPKDPAFFDLNLRELQSIDQDRVEQAVKRLATVEPVRYRTDIAARLRELLETGDKDLRSDLARALAVWSQPGDGSIEAVHEAAAEIDRKGGEVPRPMIEFLVKGGDSRAIDFIHGLWLERPGDWEALYGDLGSTIEEPVIEALDADSLLLRVSAIRLLERVGTDKSLAPLERVREGAQGEIRTQIEQALAAIRKRG